jgi:hypothetical protein
MYSNTAIVVEIAGTKIKILQYLSLAKYRGARTKRHGSKYSIYRTKNKRFFATSPPFIFHICAKHLDPYPLSRAFMGLGSPIQEGEESGGGELNELFKKLFWWFSYHS